MSRSDPVSIISLVGFGVQPRVVWKLVRLVYILCSAPKPWHDRLLEVMHACSFDSRVSDEGVLRLLDEERNVVEVLALHADDTLGGGTSDIHHAMQKVCESLKVGSCEKDIFP